MRSLIFTGAGTDILQKHSINSILEHREEFLIEHNCETTTDVVGSPINNPINIVDILNFGQTNNNNMMLGSSADVSPLTPTLGPYAKLTPSSTQSSTSPGTLSANSFDVFQFDNVAQNSTPLKAFQRNISFDCSAPLSPSTPTSLYNRSFHNSPLVSDSGNSSSANGLSLDSIPLAYQQSNNYNAAGGITSSSRSNSPESQNSNQSNSEYSILDLMNLLSLSPEQQQQPSAQQHQQQQQPQQKAHNLTPLMFANTPTSSTTTPSSTTTTNFVFDEPNSTTKFENGMSAVDVELAKLQSMKQDLAVNTLKLLQAQAQAQAAQTQAQTAAVPFLNQLLQANQVANQQHQMRNWQQQMTQTQLPSVTDAHLIRIAKFHRSSAAHCDATCTWSGELPLRSHRQLTYSPKVFLGGIPWDISEQSLIQIFKPFGQIRVEWPGKEQQAAQPKGYVYIIFESDKQVKALLSACAVQMDDSQTSGNYYYKISSRRIKCKDVEVIPWLIADSNYVKSTSQRLDPTRTIFVGALHGKLTAEGLAKIMDDLFDGVLYAGIDTDKYKYPIGSGRVTFNNNRSYMRAVSAAFVEIRHMKFTKKVQIDPYLEDALCSICGVQHGPYYCREWSCFRYFCRSCWQWQHCSDEVKNHIPLTRNSKSQVLFGIGPSAATNFSTFNAMPTRQQQQQELQQTQHQQQQQQQYAQQKQPTQHGVLERDAHLLSNYQQQTF